jgi:hypothetical protein
MRQRFSKGLVSRTCALRRVSNAATGASEEAVTPGTWKTLKGKFRNFVLRSICEMRNGTLFGLDAAYSADVNVRFRRTRIIGAERR